MTAHPADSTDAGVSASPPHRGGGELNIGSRLRHTRIMRGLTLKELADQADCSQSFISKLENGKVNPSFAMLHRLAGVLGVGMSQFLDEEEGGLHPDAMVFPAARRLRTVTRIGENDAPALMLEALTPRGNRRLLQANLHHVAPGAGTEGMVQAEGETFGLVLEGEIELILAGEARRLVARDSFLFPSALPAGYRNTGSQPAILLWVNTPPTD